MNIIYKNQKSGRMREQISRTRTFLANEPPIVKDRAAKALGTTAEERADIVRIAVVNMIVL